jgi:hypothetical protein
MLHRNAGLAKNGEAEHHVRSRVSKPTSSHK